MQTLESQSDGRVLIGGCAKHPSLAIQAPCLFRLLPDGRTDDSFLTWVGPLNGAEVSAVLVEASGSVLVGLRKQSGNFTGQVSRLIRLGSNGAARSSQVETECGRALESTTFRKA
jgi:Domain of unknown function (DUF5122) beta-propeller